MTIASTHGRLSGCSVVRAASLSLLNWNPCVRFTIDLATRHQHNGGAGQHLVPCVKKDSQVATRAWVDGERETKATAYLPIGDGTIFVVNEWQILRFKGSVFFHRFFVHVESQTRRGRQTYETILK